MITSFLSIHCAQWSIDLCRKRHSRKQLSKKPLVLVEQRKGVQKAVRFSEEFAGTSPVENESLQLAQAMHPDTVIESFDPDYDLDSLNKLALWCLKWSPYTGVDPLRLSPHWERYNRSPLYDGIIIDCRGLDRIYNGTRNLAFKLRDIFNRRQIKTRLGFGPTLGAAWAFARFGQMQVNVPDRDWQENLLHFPLAALRLRPEHENYLTDLGLHTIKDLIKIPRSEVGTRLGEKVFLQYERLIGTQPEKFTPLREPYNFVKRRNYELPIRKTSLVAQETQKILQTLLADLSRHNRRARSFSLQFTTTNDMGEFRFYNKNFSLYLSTDNKTLQSLLLPLIENIRFEGYITEILIQAEATELFLGTQQQMFLQKHEKIDNNNQQEIANFLNMISTKIPKEKIRTYQLRQSYLPEQSFSLCPLHTSQHSKESLHVDHLRPSFLFAEPLKIEVIALLPDRPPHFIMLYNIRRRVVRSFGPERIQTEWWKGNSADSRDYFIIEDDHGLLLWIFRRSKDQTQLLNEPPDTYHEKEWFLHGLWQ